MLTLDQIDIINRISEVAASGGFLTDEQDGAMAALDEIQQQMKQKVTAGALTDAEWRYDSDRLCHYKNTQSMGVEVHTPIGSNRGGWVDIINFRDGSQVCVDLPENMYDLNELLRVAGGPG